MVLKPFTNARNMNNAQQQYDLGLSPSEIAEIKRNVRNHDSYVPADQRFRKQVDKVGKLHKAKRTIMIAERLENIEVNAMRIAYKANRSESQANDRRAKRK